MDKTAEGRARTASPAETESAAGTKPAKAEVADERPENQGVYVQPPAARRAPRAPEKQFVAVVPVGETSEVTFGPYSYETCKVYEVDREAFRRLRNFCDAHQRLCWLLVLPANYKSWLK